MKKYCISLYILQLLADLLVCLLVFTENLNEFFNSFLWIFSGIIYWWTFDIYKEVNNEIKNIDDFVDNRKHYITKDAKEYLAVMFLLVLLSGCLLLSCLYNDTNIQDTIITGVVFLLEIISLPIVIKLWKYLKDKFKDYEQYLKL